MSSDNTGWQSPSDGDPSGSESAPGYGAGTQPPAYGQYQPPAPGERYGQYNQQAGAYPAGPGGFFTAPKPGIIPLRPLSITEILGGAFESLRANPRAMFLPALLVMGTSALVSAVLIFGAINPFLSRLSAFDEYDQYDGSVSDTEILGSVFSMFQGVWGSSLISSAITFIAATVLTGLLIVTVSRSVLGRIATPAEVWERTRPRLWALIGQSILINLLVGLVMILALVGAALIFAGLFYSAVNSDNPGSILALAAILGLLLVVGAGAAVAFVTVRLSVAGAALILENVGVWEGIRRSWQLTRSNFWHVLGTLLLTVLIVGVVSNLVGGAVGIITGSGTLLFGAPASAFMMAVSAFIGGLLDAVIMPFSSAATALIYIDLRMRQEGLDVELRRSAGV
ncbi:glycerophosphoryl diester phosphodiesterase membrane domain-containing protein [Actinomyces sp.]|uniref:glycerophosphoryl diester phosphodiesterase membrane domain-containing protein n=1 Tax=Actinomyces sp. TaxID=29317 RepID=UPI0026DB2B7A|nr:glycerophosphoryl diester phosphodiesterase membrane domain-containing protein [Actinomyces sp.]MDO4899407.1 glycerophosphoryl diester phosphodiesterase membrane domain-containing protein [Actinomyces sp.]